MRLIDADALMEKVQFRLPIDNYNAEVISGCVNITRRLIDEAPTIDAVPVVRCKECKLAFVNEHHPNKPLICGLTKMCGTTSPEWFCADGERRSDE